MSFNSPIFLFLFFPAVLLIYFLLNRKFRNFFLVTASLVFYYWSGPDSLYIILGFVVLNYIFGLLIQWGIKEEKKAFQKWLLFLGIGANITALFILKGYLAFLISGIFEWTGASLSASLVSRLDQLSIKPLGISFVSFAAVSYLVDIYFGRTKSEKKIIDFSLFVLFFPKIIAGPITRYSEINDEIKDRKITTTRFADGVRRFIRGLAKKILIADILFPVVDGIFSLTKTQLTPALAWIGAAAFTLQIYFDFSGYTDMAIGIGYMFGFRLPENFNYPYIAQSVSEFWRRWHITLSNWFRDYIFFPLERARRGKLKWPQAGNVLIVFILTGIWHGVGGAFLAWGVLHGIMIVLETSERAGGYIKKLPVWVKHSYTMSFIVLSWVVFRSPTFPHSGMYLATMFGLNKGSDVIPFSTLAPIETYIWIIMMVGMLLSIPVQNSVRKLKVQKNILAVVQDIGLVVLMILSILSIMGSTFNSFVYAQF